MKNEWDLESRGSSLAEELACTSCEATWHVWATGSSLVWLEQRDGCGVEAAGKVDGGLSVEGFVGHTKALGSRKIVEGEFQEERFQ